MKRFHEAQRYDFDTALAEVSRGRKTSHWIWYIFPQLRGLGRSSTANFYGLDGITEARVFAADPILIGNLRRITRALLGQPERNPRTIFGGTDARKLQSCMTLFELADPDCELYSRVLEEFYQGRRDSLTLEKISP